MLYRLIKNEVFKIFLSKKIYAIMIVMLFFTILPKFEELVGNIDIPVHGQNLPIYMLGTHVIVIIPLFIIVAVAQMFTEEYTAGTLKNTLLHPVTRTRLLNAKLLGLVVTVMALLLFGMLIAYGFGTLFFGWGNSFYFDGQYYTTGEGFMITIGSYLAAVVPLMVFAMVMMLLSFFFTSSGVLAGISIGLLVLMNLSGEMFKMLQPYLLVGSFRGFPITVFVEGDMANAGFQLLVMAVYSVISYGVSVMWFKRKDLAY
ncbi:MAG: ABC transporter permease [Bacillaceae bacterium]|nr:ABC transporter permease [Bacillaceae bacterium]